MPRNAGQKHKYVYDSTLFEVCERNGASLMQESVDIAAKWTENNFMKLKKEKSKKNDYQSCKEWQLSEQHT